MKVVKEDKWCTLYNLTQAEVRQLTQCLTFVEEEMESFQSTELDLGEVVELTWEQKLDRFTFLQHDGSHFKFLTGLLPYFQEHYPGAFTVEDRTEQVGLDNIEIPADYLQGITLYGYQKRAVEKALIFRRGILDIPTRGGKTEVMLAITKYYLENLRPDGKVILLEPDAHLMHQTHSRALTRGLEDVGRLGDGHRELNHKVVVCIINSLYNIIKDPSHEDFPIIKKTTGIFVDEVHHLGSPTMSQVPLVLGELDLMIGVSGSPFNDRTNPYSNPGDVAIVGLLEKIIFKVSARYLMDNGYIAEPHVFILGYAGGYPKHFIKNYQKVYNRYLLWYNGRNKMIVDSVKLFYENNFNCLVLTTRLDHGKFLMRSISTFAPEVLFAFGGGRVIRNYPGELPDDLPSDWDWHQDKEDQKKGLKYIRYPGNQQELIDNHFTQDRGVPLVCSTIFDEGVDLPQVDALILAGGQGRSDVKNVQRPARALTRNEHGNKVIIVDFWDNRHRYLRKHSELRIEAYKENQYFIHTGGMEELEQNVFELRRLKEKNAR